MISKLYLEAYFLQRKNDNFEAVDLTRLGKGEFLDFGIDLHQLISVLKWEYSETIGKQNWKRSRVL